MHFWTIPGSSLEEEEERRYNLRVENSRKKPAWMMDCDDINTDDGAYFALYADSDPILFMRL